MTMRALAEALPRSDRRAMRAEDAEPRSLSELFGARARSHPGRLAVIDQTRRESWSGRPQIEWTYGWARRMVERLAAYLDTLQFPPGATVGICLANGSESYLSILAVEKAGLTPCLLPLTWDEASLARAVTTTKLQVVITQGRVGEDRPAARFARVQAAQFRLRTVLGFGPDLPSGVVDLDRVLMDPWLNDEVDAIEGKTLPDCGVITFDRAEEMQRPVFRSSASLLSSAASILATSRAGADERFVTLLPPDDHAALATGLASALLAGGALECHGVFSAASLIDSLDDPRRARLVAPGWMEEALAEFELPAAVSPVLVHQPPLKFKPGTALANATVDVLAFDELALISSPRSARGLFTSGLDPTPPGEASRPIRIRVGGDGSLQFDGPAADIAAVEDNGRPARAPSGWKPSRFKVERFAGVAIGVA